MKTILRRTCGGHDYTFDLRTCEVMNNYGVVRARVLFHKYCPTDCPYIYTLYAGSEGFDALATECSPVSPTDDQLARFAVGETAAAFPED